MRAAFSLVELSIVLVILGLLTGGILAGQSLIRASELRTLSTDYNRYVAAILSFQDKYFGLPGDITNASKFWGAADGNDGIGADCYGMSTPGTGTTTCNGNGNGIITIGNNEMFRSWEHLANAGLIEGDYTGIAGPGGGNHHVPGSNCPVGRLSAAGYSLGTLNHAGDGAHYAFNYGTSLQAGAATAASLTDEAILKPEEAWNIDTKLDDGLPGQGKMFAMMGGGAGFNNVQSCSTSTSSSDYAGLYRLSLPAIRCALIMRVNP